METVNERTTLILTVAFFDEDDVACVPSSARYRIDDKTSGTAVLGWTTIAPLAVSVDLHILKGWNSMVSETHQYETRVVTVEFQYGTGRQGTDEYTYRIKNLYGIAVVASASISASPSAS